MSASATGLLLGVDVGNSKTELVVSTDRGDVLAAVRGPGASPQRLGVERAWSVITDLTGHALKLAGQDARAVQAAAFAVAGLDFPDDEKNFAAAQPSLLARAATAFWNDTFAVLRAGVEHPGTGGPPVDAHPAGDGIAVVAGSGMNCVGTFQGRTVRFPALGPISGDWGGGLMLADAAIAAACRAADGRGRPTLLHDAVLAYFDVASTDALLRDILAGTVAQDDVLHLARTVLHLADAGDEVCAALVRRQADETVALARAASVKLFGYADPTPLPLVLGGSILQSSSRVLRRRLLTQARRHCPHLTVTVPPHPPVAGALLLAHDAYVRRCRALSAPAKAERIALAHLARQLSSWLPARTVDPATEDPRFAG